MIHDKKKIMSDNLLGLILKDVEHSKNLLIRAVNKGETEIIEKIVDSLPSIDEKKRDDIIWNVLHVIPISELTPKVFEMLIKNGPSTHYISRKPISLYEGYSYPIHDPDLNLLDCFVIEQRNDLLRKLFEKYDINPLMETCNNDHRYWHWRRVPHLFITLMDNNYDGAKLLIEYGADINQLCTVRRSPWFRYQSHKIFFKPLCYQVLEHCSEENMDALVEFMLDFGADLSDPEMLRECCKDESIIKKIEDFYKEPKKRAKPDQD